MKPIGDAAEDLQTILQAEERLYIEMRELLKRERELIVNLDAVGLEEAVRRKEALAEEGRLLEESRLEVTARLAGQLKIPLENPTLSQICDHIGTASAPLRQSHSRLVALIGAVRELLDANAGFAGESLGQVRATLQLLGRLLPTDSIYEPGRAPQAEAPVIPGQLLRRLV